jgi:2-dehydro-3-deoxyphosphogluconate aldolase/(4S)-4-hydroxy-2-oxoglutarate aldolase
MTRTMPEILGLAPVVPVLTIARAGDAVPLARALVAGGLTVLEITLRTPAALEAVRAIARDVPQALAGVGTVTAPEELAAAAAAGAAFAVSPGLDAGLIAAAGAARLPYLPGIATATELMAARRAGLTCLKFFPAEPAGGRAMLAAFAGPFPEMRFCPTGGIRQETLAAWLALPNVITVGGSWMATEAMIAAGDWPGIAAKARAAVAIL